MSRSRTRSIVVLSDLHVGSTAGLWPESITVEGGGQYRGNRAQLWLLRCWQQAVEHITAMRPRPIVVLNGDLIQGVHARDGQLVTGKLDVQVQAACELLAPIARRAARLYVIRGTEWHDGKAGEQVELLAAMLEAKQCEHTRHFSRWELYLRMADMVVHFTHHVGRSSVPLYEATIPLRNALISIVESTRFGAVRPHVFVRSHRHRFIHVDAPPDIHAVVTPGWQLRTAYAYRRVAQLLPQIGYIWLEYDARMGDILVRKRIFPLPSVAVEEV